MSVIDTLLCEEQIGNCLEVVKLGSNYVHRIKDLKLHDQLERHLQIVVYQQDKYRPGKFPGSHPVTLLNRDIDILLTGDYVYSEKLDGTRYILFAIKLLCNNSIPQYVVCLMDRKCDIFVLTHLFIPIEHSPCVLEGEMVHPENDVSKFDFFLFNIVMIRGYHVNRYRYEDAMKMCDDFLKVVKIDTTVPFVPFQQIFRKPIFYGHQIDIVYQRAFQGIYKCDGFIVTDNGGERVLHGSDYNSFKIKDIHTPDVLVLPSTKGWETHLTIFSLGRPDPETGNTVLTPIQEQSRRSFFSTIKNSINIQDVESWSGKIFECEWSPKTNVFWAIKLRPDKVHPNPTEILTKTQQNIREGSLKPKEMTEFLNKHYAQKRQELTNKLFKKSQQPISKLERRLSDKPEPTHHYLDTLMEHSNWKSQIMTTPHEMNQELMSLNLSYQALLEPKTKADERQHLLDTMKTKAEKLSTFRMSDPMTSYYDWNKGDIICVHDQSDGSTDYFVVGVSK